MKNNHTGHFSHLLEKLSEHNPSKVNCLLVSFILVLTAFVLQNFVFFKIGTLWPAVFLFPAVALSAFYGGLFGAATSTAISLIIVLTSWIDHHDQAAEVFVTDHDLVQMKIVIFSINCFILCSMGYILHRFKATLQARNKELENLLHSAKLEANEIKRLNDFRSDIERIAKHDVRSPLAGIITLPDILAESDNLSSEDKAHLQLIKESGKRILRTIENSYEIYSVEQDKYSLNKTEINIIHIIDSMLILFHSEIKNKRLTINTHRSDNESSFLIIGDEALAYLMFENIARNAIEASPEGKCIDVSFEIDLGKVLLTNPGEVPHSIRANFFDKYVTAEKDGGSGLGTYSAKLIADKHGWDISLDTSVPGMTTIVIDFSSSRISNSKNNR